MIKEVYDPMNRTHRKALADSLIDMLNKAGFELQECNDSEEDVYSFSVNSKIKIYIYSTIEDNECRLLGEDSIKIIALFFSRDNQPRMIGAAKKRVYRVGIIEEIVQRTLEKMRIVYQMIFTAYRCKRCGAPKFLSAKDNFVCADLCWAV